MTDSTKIKKEEVTKVYDNLDDFSKLFEELERSPNPDDSKLINSILIKIPETKHILKDQIIEKINEISGVEISTLEMTYKGLHKDVFSKLFDELEKNPIIEPIINSILIKIPVDNHILKDQTFRKIKKITGTTIPTLKTIYKELHKPKKKSTKKDEFSKTNRLLFLKATMEDENPENKYMVYDNSLIEITKSEINLLELPYKKSSKYERITVTGFSLDILYKTLDRKNDNITLFTFKKNNEILNNYELSDFLKKFDSEIIKKRIGTEVIKYIFSEKSKYCKNKKPKYILGFNNGWYLPINEEKIDYTIICYTDEQKQIFQNCKNIYKQYSNEEKLKIRPIFKKFIKLTQIKPTYLSIIIGWSMIAPFKLFFISNYKLFPHLILIGKRYTGKTSFLDFIITLFFKHYKTHLSAQSIETLARFEDMTSGSTLPVFVDEFDNIIQSIVNVLLEMATSTSDYKRKLSVKSQISRPRIVPFSTTSNKLGKFYMKPAHNSRAIILTIDDSMTRDQTWVDLKEKLEKEKLFSFLYDYTKDWTNKDLKDLIKETEEKYKIDEYIKRISDLKIIKYFSEKYYPRIRDIYMIILTGVNLFENIFDIKLETDGILKVLIESRKQTSFDLLSKFKEFCILKTTYDPKEISRYISCGMVTDKYGNYIFRQIDLEDFNRFMGHRYFLKPLYEILNEGLDNKSLIKLINTTPIAKVTDDRVQYIGIDPTFLEEPKEITEFPEFKSDKKKKTPEKKEVTKKKIKEKKEDIKFGEEIEEFDWTK